VRRHDGRSRHRGPLAAACGLWSRVVRPGLFRLHGLRDLGPCGVEEALRQAARPRTELRGLELRGLEPRGLRLCLRWAQRVVERPGLCGRGLCWARAQRPRVAQPQVATRRLCGRLGLCGVGSKVPGPIRSWVELSSAVRSRFGAEPRRAQRPRVVRLRPRGLGAASGRATSYAAVSGLAVAGCALSGCEP
jgi:hypothetical protein